VSIVRNTQQARNLQRCSTDGCIVCEKQGRLLVEAVADEWHTYSDNSSTILNRVIPRRFWTVCAKHKHWTGVRVKQHEWRGKPIGQYVRWRVTEPSQRLAMDRV
jgi:hypothetical protein